jgi:hypothetical protein
VLLAERLQCEWAANLPRIADVSEELGFTNAELLPGGSVCQEILERVRALGANLPKLTGKARRDAEKAAEKNFGPQGQFENSMVVSTEENEDD